MLPSNITALLDREIAAAYRPEHQRQARKVLTAFAERILELHAEAAPPQTAIRPSERILAHVETIVRLVRDEQTPKLAAAIKVCIEGKWVQVIQGDYADMDDMHADLGWAIEEGLHALTALDEQRWAVVEEAISTPDLTSDLARLAAISAVVNSRTPPTNEDIQWAKSLTLVTPEPQTAIRALSTRLNRVIDIIDRNLLYPKGQRPLGWAELLAVQADVLALCAETPPARPKIEHLTLAPNMTKEI